MVAVAIAMFLAFDEIERIPMIFRFDSSELEKDWIPKFVTRLEENYYDTLCIKGKNPFDAAEMKRLKLKTIDAKEIDTAANMKWRNKTIDFTMGKLSPKDYAAFLATDKSTVHFLSSPTTPDLRTVTKEQSLHMYFVQALQMTLPGRPLWTSSDHRITRFLPGPGAVESWILAFNDHAAPLMYQRKEWPWLNTAPVKVIRADSTPGLLIYERANGAKKLTVMLNNSNHSIPIPNPQMDKVSMNKGLDLDGAKPSLLGGGFLLVNEAE